MKHKMLNKVKRSQKKLTGQSSGDCNLRRLWHLDSGGRRITIIYFTINQNNIITSSIKITTIQMYNDFYIFVNLILMGLHKFYIIRCILNSAYRLKINKTSSSFNVFGEQLQITSGTTCSIRHILCLKNRTSLY